MKNIKLVATDLDGTFLKNDRSITKENLVALNRLGEKDILRIAATGRNLKKVRDVIPISIPFDFVIYSSGAGIYDWKKQKHIYNRNIEKSSAIKIFYFLLNRQINFHAFFPSPENHKHWFYRGNNYCEEFERYFQFNKAFSTELEANKLPDSEVCQFLIIIPEDENRFAKLKSEIEMVCSEIRVIRASSPIAKGFIWIEIFHKTVSKGNAVKFICDLFGIQYANTMGVGNDYNDFDLLGFTKHSFLTENAPDEIKDKFPQVPSNENDAFSIAIKPLIE